MDSEHRPEIEAKTDTEGSNAVALLLEKLEQCGFQEDFQGEAGALRKEKLERIAKQLPEIADSVLRKFRDLTKAEGLNAGLITFFVVGGRVRGTPIKDNTDFDVVITAENRLSPFVKEPTITLAQRHAIGRALYAEIENIFATRGLDADYEKGILEIKGFGERTAKEVQGEEDTLKITELALE